MKIYESVLYQEEIAKTSHANIKWDLLANKKLLIVGASGLIGRFLVDLLMYHNVYNNLNCKLTLIVRNEEKLHECFMDDYFKSPLFTYKIHNIQKPLDFDNSDKYDYIFHLASNTHPVFYSTYPIDTILTNVYGLKNILDFAVRGEGTRVVLTSSVEIYGENRGDVEYFDEKYIGYLDCNTMRAGYPESKRVCETLCHAYKKEKNVDFVVARLPRIFGPTMGKEDSKAAAQFIKKAVSGQDIVLKSKGNQEYSFLYMIDAVLGLLFIMLNGESGEAYNIASVDCDGQLKEVAEICSLIGNTKVVFEIPDEIEKAGYSTATKAKLDGTKIKKMGWEPLFNLKDALTETIDILRSVSM